MCVMYIHTYVCMFVSQVYAGLDYSAQPADIWSCGIVLVALLVGGKLKQVYTMYSNTKLREILEFSVYFQ